MILESNILELLIERDALKSIEIKNDKEIEKSIMLKPEKKSVVDEPNITSRKAEESSGSTEKQEKTFPLNGTGDFRFRFVFFRCDFVDSK